MAMQLVQFVGSLAAILLLAFIAHKLGLGGDIRIRDTDQARALANETVDGFDPVEISIDRAGYGALLRDADGRVLLLRRHGARFVGRLLDSHAKSRLDQQFITIGTHEKRFGTVTLDLGPQAQAWAASLRRL
ncbi:hypothetical protein [Tsuneonella suprasediminis]|uniref:Uncharacterized protein n=1 Tax=Tsuneonella suprasediminis TaxID=2306996 RepID=A0A419QYL3_9SPHN|nr:hypothetical protein [Tsuneonella suprasediminis]RJX65648.1 hypothetical protein D6858_15230 [Tsuneonella suprasediminis]UBS33525.1 hypothetical protein LBX01_02540 [Altererythrobacter sp. N1]